VKEESTELIMRMFQNYSNLQVFWKLLGSQIQIWNLMN